MTAISRNVDKSIIRDNHMISGLTGDSAIAIIVQCTSAPLFSTVIGPTPSTCFLGSLVVWSRLIFPRSILPHHLA
ncbi:MAG: hypothetical protein H5U07_01805 [Candidatus Aminicenantes bacterium]|nr:hypothetical protein [Candidatus Aminicenantes bacterium]